MSVASHPYFPTQIERPTTELSWLRNLQDKWATAVVFWRQLGRGLGETQMSTLCTVASPLRRHIGDLGPVSQKSR